MAGNDKELQHLSEERERMHRAMMSSVSHDLKTPLASIIGSLEIYERMHDRLADDKKTALIRTALTESYRLDNFITNILDMAKLENDLVAPRSEPVALESLLRDILIGFGPRLDKEQVNLPRQYPAIEVLSDTTLYARAISIIIDNAIKHGAYPVSIVAALGANGKELLLTISDAGPGIPRGREEAIFSKYTRFAKSDHQHAGTGLGLSICREIMRLLGGSVHVMPSSVGAQFILALPLKPAANKA